MEITHIHLEEVDSTNNYLKLHYQDLPDAVLVTADTQTAGRGRLNRMWFSPSGNIYASFLMRKFDTPFYATVTASMAALKTLRFFAPERQFYIKWPNDIYVGTSKIAGILSECIVVPAKIDAVISGMGINVNSTREEFADAGVDAVSLRTLLKQNFDTALFRNKLAENLLECYTFGFTHMKELFESWKQENVLIGKELAFTDAVGNEFTADFLDINADGEAVIKNRQGEIMTFRCGDVRISKNSITIE